VVIEMAFSRKDILSYQLKTVNPFQGLVIDADTWRDAHNYHHDHQRLHILMFHGTGIVQGLNVSASNPADISINISPGVAIDEEGNVIIVGQIQRYRIQTRDKGVIYLIIQFREVPGEPYQQPNNQPTRILEAYRIEERDKLPNEPCLELARIDFDPADATIRDPANPAVPRKNEINANFRNEIKKGVIVQPKIEYLQPQPSRPSAEKIVLGHSVLGKGQKDIHVAGLRNLVREFNRQGTLAVELHENISLDGDIAQYSLIYLVGNGSFQLTTKQQTSLSNYLQAGRMILGEGCSEGLDNQSRGLREFGLSYNQLASQIKCKLEIVQRGHPLLSSAHVFSEVPPGAESGTMLLEGSSMVYSGCDYGCAWIGGHQEKPLSRDIIRNAFEIGDNLISYAQIARGNKI
jgi:hypothetical protein